MPTLASLLVQETKTQIYTRGLALAETIGLNVTSWVVGDPTRSLYHFLSDALSRLETMVAGFIGSGFLDYATDDWLTLLAQQFYDVERVEATYATSTITLTNGGGGVFTIAAGDAVAKNSSTGKTFTSTSGGTLSASSTLDIDVTADEAGSDSSSVANEIDALVTTMLGVTVTASTTAIGVDEESDESLRDRCRAKLAALSPNGPRDAYNFVVRSSELTGVTDITRARTVTDAATVIVYVAGASGAVAGASVTAAQAAIDEWATPNCITATVTNVSNVTVAVTYTVWIYESVGADSADIEEAIEDALGDMFAARPIGGDIISPATTGKLYQSLIVSTIKEVFPDHIFRVTVSDPTGDTSLAINQVAVLGAVTATINIEEDP